jgi:hypothetical protein
VAMLKKRGLRVDGEDSGIAYGADENDPVLAACAQASMTGTLALGPRAGKRVLRLVGVVAGDDHVDRKKGAPTVYWFNLHARQWVDAHDRKGLERLLR